MNTCPTCRQDLPPSKEITLDAPNGVLLVGGEAIRLPPRMCRFMQALITKMPNFVHIETIYQAVYGDRLDPPMVEGIRVCASNLRTKLAGTGYAIEVQYDYGYRLIERAGGVT